MGFETIVAAIMVTAVILAVAYTFISGSVSIAETSIEGYKSIVYSTVKRLQTHIDILNVTYTSPTLTAYFKNTGEVRFADFSRFDVFIYGRTETGSTIADYVENTSYTIVRELINPGIFDPHETAELQFSLQLDNGTYVLVICTPNAVCDSAEFSVP